jgi:hypothetical protein
MANSSNERPTVHLEAVESLLEVRENIRRFQQGIAEHHDRALQSAVQTTYWIYDPQTDDFGPSKFVGFKRMTFPNYILADNNQATGARFDGGLTHRAIEAVAGPFHASPEFTAKLKGWLDTTFGADAVSGISIGKWQFVDLQAKLRYWAVCCQPETYDGRRALENLDEMCWSLDRGDPQPGDKIVVWQAKGQRGRRGVIGLGEVTEKPAVREETPQEQTFYLNGTSQKLDNRTKFRVLRHPGLPLWESDHPELLSNLSVAKARGGTVFNVTASQWAQLLELAQRNGAVEPATVKQKVTGQGFGLTAAERTAVERHAQALAENYFLERRYQVTDVSRTSSYDLHCVRDDQVLHVEVKGTTGGGDTFFLTANEVELAKKYPQLAALVFVKNIRLRRDDGVPTAEGGERVVLQPWEIDQGTLTPIQFDYRLPEGR